MKKRTDFVFRISLIMLLLVFFVGNGVFAGGMDELNYQPVRVTGNLEKRDGKFFLEDKFVVNPGELTPEAGYSEIFGAVFPGGEGKLPELYILTVKTIEKCPFSVAKWEKPIKLTGRRPEVIMQHPVEPLLGKIDYFESNRWQIVVYFKQESEYKKYQTVRYPGEVTISGVLQPVFAGSKNPKDIGKLKKNYQGFRIVDAKVVEIKQQVK
ncbi:MAG: hypothetical protein LWY06_05060 [Firmicutes bacterium]|nr:hypothetical protein [Bacillota bacterium]